MLQHNIKSYINIIEIFSPALHQSKYNNFIDLSMIYKEIT